MYKFLKITYTLFVLFFMINLQAQENKQTGSIKGKLTDEVTLEPLAFANVYIEKLDIGTVSDDNGEFLIENIAEGRYNIKFSYIGYNEKTITEARINRNKTLFFEVALTQNSLALEQVEVKAYKYENLSSMPVSTYSMSREEIFRSPASNGNIFRAISTIPGVQSGGGSFASLAVRGQGSEENATFVDEFPVFELSHLAGGGGGFDDPNGGRFSIFGPRAVDGLVLQTGGFSALHGRRSSSYMELNIKEGNPENPEIDALISLTGAALSYSGPIGNKMKLYSSLRYQNFFPALTLTQQADLGFPSFADLTLKLTSDISDKSKLTILTLFNPERFDRTTENVVKDDNAENNLENNFLADVDNSKGLFGAKLKTIIGSKSNWTNLAYLRFKSTNTYFGVAYPTLDSGESVPEPESILYNDKKGLIDNTEREIGIRSIFTTQLTNKATLKAGVDLARIEIDHNRSRSEPDTIYSFYRNDLPENQKDQNYFVLNPEFYNTSYDGGNNNASAYFNLLYKLSSSLSTNIGMRVDYTGFSEQVTFSPRINFNYSLSEQTSFTLATGIYYQDPLNIFIADNNGNPLKAEKAIHYIAGVKHYLNADLKITAEAYYKSFSDLIARPNTNINAIANIGEGNAYGVDFSIIKRLSNKFNGQISYSYSQSERDNNDGLGVYDHLYSQPHIFNFLVGFQPNSNWVFAAKLRYSTGQPTNSSIIHQNIFDSDDFQRYGQELTGRNDIRNDYFLGIDLRIDRRIQFKKFSINAFLDIQNATNRENASTRTFYEITGSYKPQALGILPTIGWRFEI